MRCGKTWPVMIMLFMCSRLAAAEDAQAYRTEVFVLEWTSLAIPFDPVATSMSWPGNGSGFGIRFFTPSWKYLYITIIDFQAGWWGGQAGFAHMYAGSQVGFPLRFGDRHQHQIKFGLGLGVGWMGSRVAEDCVACQHHTSDLGIRLAPVLRYSYHTEHKLFLGTGVRTILPVQPGKDRHTEPTSLVQVFLEVGFH